LNDSTESIKNYTTIKSYIENAYNELFVFSKEFTAKQEELLQSNLNCFNNCLELFYKLLENSKLVEKEFSLPHTTVNRMPDPFKWLNLENNISNLLQYLINPENFYKEIL
jgi:hypothetical protein